MGNKINYKITLEVAVIITVLMESDIAYRLHVRIEKLMVKAIVNPENYFKFFC